MGEERFLRRSLYFAPAAITECAQRRKAFSNTDIARDEKRLFKRNIESGFVRELQDDNFLFEAILLQPLNAAILADSVLEMNNEISFHDFGEVDRRSSASEPRPPKGEAASARALITTKNLRIAQNFQFDLRINKAASHPYVNETDSNKAHVVSTYAFTQAL